MPLAHPVSLIVTVTVAGVLPPPLPPHAASTRLANTSTTNANQPLLLFILLLLKCVEFHPLCPNPCRLSRLALFFTDCAAGRQCATSATRPRQSPPGRRRTAPCSRRSRPRR